MYNIARAIFAAVIGERLTRELEETLGGTLVIAVLPLLLLCWAFLPSPPAKLHPSPDNQPVITTTAKR